MEGAVVENGSTISTTGEMQVSCNVPYVLSVDGVEWTPISSDGGVDTYLLTTAGVVRIFVDEVRQFIFTNAIALDFQLNRSEIVQYNGSTQLTDDYTNGYFQGKFQPTTDRLIVYVSRSWVTPTTAPADLINFGITASQGSVTTDVYGNYARAIITNVDPTQPMVVYIGNVLVAFVSPRD